MLGACLSSTSPAAGNSLNDSWENTTLLACYEYFVDNRLPFDLSRVPAIFNHLSMLLFLMILWYSDGQHSGSQLVANINVISMHKVHYCERFVPKGYPTYL